MSGTWPVTKLRSLLFSWRAMLILIVMLGMFLRTWHYWEFPVVGETQDEVAWTWLGSSLIQTGVPHSWSYFSGYQNRQYWQSSGGSAYEVVYPVLDHPPMFSLLPGAAHALKNSEWLQLPSAKVIRLPVVLLSFLSLGLFLVVVRSLQFPKLAQGAALAVFALAPTSIWLQRLVVAENLLLMWWLAFVVISLWAANRWKTLGLFLVAAAFPLTKVSGLALLAGLVAWLWMEKQTKLVRAAVAGGITGALVFMGYAAFYDWSLFLTIQTQQAGRDTGLLTLLSTLWLSPTLIAKPLSDGWWWSMIAGLVSFVVAVGTTSPAWLKKTSSLLGWSLVSSIAFLQLSVGEHTIHGWYRIPLLAWVALAAGCAIWWIWQQRSWTSLLLLSLLAFPTIRFGLWSVGGMAWFPLLTTINKLFLVGLGIFTGVNMLFPKWQKATWYTGAIIIVSVYLLAQVATVLTITPEKYWQDVAYWQTGLRP